MANQIQSQVVAGCVFSPIQIDQQESEPLEKFVMGTVIPPVPWLYVVPSDERRGLDTPLPAVTRYTKRFFDVVGATAGILLLWPLMLASVIAIKASSQGSPIFTQERVGLNRRTRNRPNRRTQLSDNQGGKENRINERRQGENFGRPFTLYKFRTMVANAEKDGPQFAVQGDPRVTKLGRFMRQTRIDELPQLWNVLRGDMSLVGPRPERPQFVKELCVEVPNYLDRLQLKPGLTGVAQVVNGYDNNVESFKRKVAYDLLYLRNCCLLNDLKIMLRTVLVVITGKGAI